MPSHGLFMRKNAMKFFVVCNDQPAVHRGNVIAKNELWLPITPEVPACSPLNFAPIDSPLSSMRTMFGPPI